MINEDYNLVATFKLAFNRPTTIVSGGEFRFDYVSKSIYYVNKVKYKVIKVFLFDKKLDILLLIVKDSLNKIMPLTMMRNLSNPCNLTVNIYDLYSSKVFNTLALEQNDLQLLLSQFTRQS